MRNAILLKEDPDYGMLLPYCVAEHRAYGNCKEGVKWGQACILGGKKNPVILYEDQCKNKTDSHLCDKCDAKQNKYKEGSSPLK